MGAKPYDFYVDSWEDGWMTYEEFSRAEDLRQDRLRQEARRQADKQFNKGLLDGLGIMRLYLYPILKRNDS